MQLNHLDYACFNYTSYYNPTNKFQLGDVVIYSKDQIGVIIQIHSGSEVRLDSDGNIATSRLRHATDQEIVKYTDQPNYRNLKPLENNINEQNLQTN
jgi:hypothetical protein